MAEKKKRALFEDATAQKDEPAIVSAPRDTNRDRHRIAMWQFVIAALVVLMIVVGGLTRLTDSGLSITEWNLVTGVMPPLSAEGWASEFAKYQKIPEFTEMNYDMGLAEFKVIYWWEWGHRFLGRIIGLAYLIPFAIFFFRKQIPAGWTGRLLLPGVLILVQGVIGWWMVSSGLTERVDVAPYRLAVHLGVAFVIFALLVCNGLRLSRPDHASLAARRQRMPGMVSAISMIGGLTFLQILAGALVAGHDAGRGYTDWPLMNGAIIPPEATEITPFWRNIFENPALVQFDHRIIGYILFAGIIWLWFRSRKSGHAALKTWTTWVLVVATGQMLWGILTVLNGAPLFYAIIHQLGAVVLTFVLVRARYEAAYPAEQKIARA